MAELAFREVDGETWSDFAALFESSGAPKYCWCMAWRPMDAKERGSGAAKRAAMKSRVDARMPVGILAYRDGEPVGWCSIAPRETYRPLGGPDGGAEIIWSLACFFIRREWRGRKFAEALLGAAVAQAARKGATMVEAYPVESSSPSYRFMGFVELFRRAGFEEAGRAGTRRHVMRLAVGRGGGNDGSVGD